jgi:hypothetical protein
LAYLRQKWESPRCFFTLLEIRNFLGTCRFQIFWPIKCDVWVHLLLVKFVVLVYEGLTAELSYCIIFFLVSGRIRITLKIWIYTEVSKYQLSDTIGDSCLHQSLLNFQIPNWRYTRTTTTTSWRSLCLPHLFTRTQLLLDIQVPNGFHFLCGHVKATILYKTLALWMVGIVGYHWYPGINASLVFCSSVCDLQVLT